MLSDKLKELRKTNKITQQKIADKLNIPQTTYSNYEQGIRTPDNETLCRLADFYDVSVDYLLGRVEPAAEDMADDARMIARKYEKLTDKQKAFIQSAIDTWDDDE